jgi:hypothetical protein
MTIFSPGMRIGRIKVIFTFPQQIIGTHQQDITSTNLPQEPFAFIEWYTKLQTAPEAHHSMYKVSKPLPYADGCLPGAIIPLTDIRQSCQLIPKFMQAQTHGESMWKSETVLDQASTFYVNNWSGLYAYQTIW